MNLGAGGGGGSVSGLLRIAETAQVRRDDIELRRKCRNAFPPHAAELGPAMKQKERRAPALAQVMDADAVRGDVVRLETGHAASLAAFQRKAPVSATPPEGSNRGERPVEVLDQIRNPRVPPKAAPAPRRSRGSASPPARVF